MLRYAVFKIGCGAYIERAVSAAEDVEVASQHCSRILTVGVTSFDKLR
jgi:hypothetical protein